MTFKTRHNKDIEPIEYGESRTEQSHKKYVDINRLVKLYSMKGPPRANINPDDYRDAPAISYHEAMNAIVEQEAKFNTLPSKVRAQFGNNPDKFQAFASNPDNLQYITEDGIIFPSEKTDESEKAEQKYQEVKPKPDE